ncbi:neuropeptide FF receptor 2-like [Branchiostoma lanceolatum]|uniref:neuropeptide FF receptor 2-like n=1 Tax=Branchiostoma lanceolatum TaxID=7740 RepID=UPI003454E83E
MNNTTFPFVDNVTYGQYIVIGPPPNLKQSVPVTVVFVSCFSLIFLLSLAGNLLVCLVVVKDRSLRNVTNYFVVNLAISDLLVTLLGMPLTLVSDILFGWRLGAVVCQLTTLQGLSLAASILTLVAIAADRYRAVLYPTARKLKPCEAFAIIGLVWMLSIATMVPHALVMQLKQYIWGEVIFYVCGENWGVGGREAYTVTFFSLYYILPLVVIAILYVRISLRISHQPNLFGLSHNKNPGISAQKLEVIKMLVIVVILFTVCWMPYHVVSFVADFGALTREQKNAVFVYAYPIVRWLGYCNSCMNPIVYGYCNKNFRKGFKGVFKFMRQENTDILVVEPATEMTTRSARRARMSALVIPVDDVEGSQSQTNIQPPSYTSRC